MTSARHVRAFGVGMFGGTPADEELMTGTKLSSEGLDPRRRKLLFRAWHRGMREMDLIMGRFADAAIGGRPGSVAAIGAAIGLLAGPLGLAVGLTTGGTIGSQVGKPSEPDPEPEALAERLRVAVPRSASAIVLIADSSDVSEMIAAIGETNANVMRKALTPEEAAAVQASLSDSPAASAGPSLKGEEAVEASEAGPA